MSCCVRHVQVGGCFCALVLELLEPLFAINATFNLKSFKLASFDLSNHNSVSEWHSFLHGIYKVFNAYIDILRHDDYQGRSPLKMFEDYLEKTDLATFEKYKKMKANYFEWKKKHTDPEFSK